MEQIKDLVAEAVGKEMELFKREIASLRDETQKLKRENSELREMVKHLEAAVDETEQYSRYNDVSWHNPDIISPRLEQLAREGVILEQNYVLPLCTPSRSGLMTGRYPFHLGRQHNVLFGTQPTGLTLNHTLLPELLQEAGYSTHMVGKWHLGFCAPEYLPQARGFQSFLGYWQGAEDYYNHTEAIGDSVTLDFWDGEKSAPELSGVYSAELYGDRAESLIREHDQQSPMFLYLAMQNVHMPLQVPQRYEDMYPSVRNADRRTFSGMVTALDDAVGKVVDALKEVGMYNNTVIVFMGDNGGLPHAGGNNYPLRGTKGTLWEGGTRTPAFVHSPLLAASNYSNYRLVHITDWLPTLLRVAGAGGGLDGDGFDQWDSIASNAPSARSEMVYNIDDFGITFQAALRDGDLKLVWGQNQVNSHWYPVPESATPPPQLADPDDTLGYSAHLFNITADPTEREDLAARLPGEVTRLQARVKQLMKTEVPADFPPGDDAGHPVDGVWTTGWCEAH
ncbi:arylsulfatase I-like isoform X2 [Pollicipes pollicipes]|uniref:arylsulfatase I-like isoform X2 n=1 Tax=Pollicipes pollicipes TaxID=41117 RepID=UPI001885312E|nr:arylsulfatase I-like isoform X2 [Pollicipes pollicipes]